MGMDSIYTLGSKWRILRELEKDENWALYEVVSEQGLSNQHFQLKIFSFPNVTEEEDPYAVFREKILGKYRQFMRMKDIPGMPGFKGVDTHPSEDGTKQQIYILSDFLPSLKERCPDLTLPEEDVLKLGIRLCRALTECEKNQLLHYGIAPSRIQCTPAGEWQFGDISVGDIVGNWFYLDKEAAFYAAPEVLSDNALSASTDTYALGMVLYRLLSSPLTGYGEEELHRARLSGTALPDPENGSPLTKEVLRKACAFSPMERFQSAREMLDALQKAKAALSGGDSNAFVQPTVMASDYVPAPKSSRIPWPLPAAVALIALLVTGYFTFHIYEDPTCTEPYVCKICGKTKGDPLGHDFDEATCTHVSTCSRCGTTTGTTLEHDFSPADCTTPMTCRLCGATKGAALGHDWKEATCTEARVCRRCGATEGSALGHDWEEATYDKPKTCRRCGLTEGDVKGIDYKINGEWHKDYPSMDGGKNTVFVLDRELKKCRFLDMSIGIKKYTGNVFGEWYFYVRSNGQWLKKGSFKVTEANKEYRIKITFDPALDIDAFYALPASWVDDRKPYSFDNSFTLHCAQEED